MTVIGSNWFRGVDFPLVVGDRYVHIGPDPAGSSAPEIQVFRWDRIRNEAHREAQARSDTALTWEYDANDGTVRLRATANDRSAATGYASGGPGDSYVVVVTHNTIRVLSGSRPIAEFASNAVSGSDIGIRVDPSAGSVSLGGRLPDGFEYRIRYESKVVKLADLVTPERPLIANREFVGCRVEGPALLTPTDAPFDLVSNRMGAPGLAPESIVWAMPPTMQPFGTIVVNNVGFENCELAAVGLAVPEADRDIVIERLFG